MVDCITLQQLGVGFFSIPVMAVVILTAGKYVVGEADVRKTLLIASPFVLTGAGLLIAGSANLGCDPVA
jgi:hypothetical protein